MNQALSPYYNGQTPFVSGMVRKVPTKLVEKQPLILYYSNKTYNTGNRR